MVVSLAEMVVVVFASTLRLSTFPQDLSRRFILLEYSLFMPFDSEIGRSLSKTGWPDLHSEEKLIVRKEY